MLSFFFSRPPSPAPPPPPPPPPAHGGLLLSFLKKAGVESGASLERVLATLNEQEVTSVDLLRSYWAEVAPLLKIVPRKRIESALGQVVPSGSAGTPRAAGTPPPPPPPPPAHSSPPALWPPMAWCHNLRPLVPRPEAPLLAAIGVTSHPERALIRQGARESWMRALPRDVHARFALPARQLEVAEAAALSAELARNPAHEFALLNVSARLGWTEAPRGLVALHWLHCAARAYPRTPYVGRACDSAWVQAAGVALMLRATLPWLGKPYEAVIGRLRAFVAPSHLPTTYRAPAQWCADGKADGKGGDGKAGTLGGLRPASNSLPSQLTATNLLQSGCFLLLSGGGSNALVHRLVRWLPPAEAPLPQHSLAAELPAQAAAHAHAHADADADADADAYMQRQMRMQMQMQIHIRTHQALTLVLPLPLPLTRPRRSST